MLEINQIVGTSWQGGNKVLWNLQRNVAQKSSGQRYTLGDLQLFPGSVETYLIFAEGVIWNGYLTYTSLQAWRWANRVTECFISSQTLSTFICKVMLDIDRLASLKIYSVPISRTWVYRVTKNYFLVLLIALHFATEAFLFHRPTKLEGYFKHNLSAWSQLTGSSEVAVKISGAGIPQWKLYSPYTAYSSIIQWEFTVWTVFCTQYTQKYTVEILSGNSLWLWKCLLVGTISWIFIVHSLSAQ